MLYFYHYFHLRNSIKIKIQITHLIIIINFIHYFHFITIIIIFNYYLKYYFLDFLYQLIFYYY